MNNLLSEEEIKDLLENIEIIKNLDEIEDEDLWINEVKNG